MALLIRTLVAILPLAIVLAGCEGRDRTNPLDPGNDETDGRPDWLTAVADDGAVDLSWPEAPPEGFDRYELFRSRDGFPFALIETLAGASRTSVRDSGLINTRTYAYRLDLVLEDGSRIQLPEKTATPGAAVPWIVENRPIGLSRLSPDARHVRVTTGSLNGYFDAQASPDGGRVWAADFYGDAVELFDGNGGRLTRIRVSDPYLIAADFDAGVVWVGTWRPGIAPTVVAFSFDGVEDGRWALWGNVLTDLVVRAGSCFAGLGSDGIARIVRNEGVVGLATTGWVEVLAAGDGLVYAADTNTRRIDAIDAGSLTVTATTATADRVSAMTVARDCVWVVDGPDRITCLDPDSLGTLRPPLSGVGDATGVAFDSESETLWLAVPASGRVVRLDTRDGSIISLPRFQPFVVTLGAAGSQ